MDRIEFLASRLEVAKTMRKKWDEREKEWKKELFALLDEEVAVISEEIRISASAYPTLNDAVEYFHRRFGNIYVIQHSAREGDDWVLEYTKLPAYSKVHYEAGSIVVDRSSYTQGDGFDLDILKGQVDDETFQKITKTTVELDEELVGAWIAEDETATDKLQAALRAGQPRVRLGIKRVEEESADE